MLKTEENKIESLRERTVLLNEKELELIDEVLTDFVHRFGKEFGGGWDTTEYEELYRKLFGKKVPFP